VNRCRRCWQPLARDHRCHFNWRRLVAAIAAFAFGGGLGAFVQLLVQPAAVPVMGAVIGAVLFSAAPGIIYRVLDDRDWHRSDVMAGWSSKRRV
jgi:purine-cytosine permease-like protein